MNQPLNSKATRYLGSIVILLVLVLLPVALVRAWTGPTANPPNDNAPVPINASSTAQTKPGLLQLATLRTFGGIFYDWLNPDTGNIEAGGKIGFKLTGFSTDALDIIGPGSSPNRKVKIWDDLYVNDDIWGSGSTTSQFCVVGGSCINFGDIINNTGSGGGNVPAGALNQTLRRGPNGWEATSTLAIKSAPFHTGYVEIGSASSNGVGLNILTPSYDSLMFGANNFRIGKTVGQTAMRFDAPAFTFLTGNVGIGAVLPTAQLHTTGTVILAGVASSPENTSNSKVITSDANGNLAWTATSSLGIGGGDSHWVTGGGLGDRIKNTNVDGVTIGTGTGLGLLSVNNGQTWLTGGTVIQGDMGLIPGIPFSLFALNAGSYFGDFIPTSIPTGEVPKVFIKNTVTTNTYDQGLQIQNAGYGWGALIKSNTDGLRVDASRMALRVNGPTSLNGAVQLPVIAGGLATTSSSANQILVTGPSGYIGWVATSSLGINGLPPGANNQILSRVDNEWKATSTIIVTSQQKVGIGVTPGTNDPKLLVNGTARVTGLSVNGPATIFGPIGIGGGAAATNPAATLDVNGTGLFTSLGVGSVSVIGTTTTTGLKVTNGASGSANKILTSIDTSGNAIWKTLAEAGIGGLPPGSVNGQTLRWSTANTPSWVPDSLITNNGTSIGIGTTVPSPLAKLDVNGNTFINGGLAVSGGASVLFNNTGNVGIGIGAVLPSAQLHTSGTVRFAGVPQVNNNSRVITSDLNGNLAWTATSSLGINGLPAGSEGQSIRYYNGAWTYSNLIKTNNNDGTVGIGFGDALPSADTKLQVIGTTTTTGLKVTNGASGSANKILTSIDTSGNAIWKLPADIPGVGLPTGSTNETLRKDATLGWVATNSLTVDDNGRVSITGNVGMGTSPSNNYKLDLFGRTKLSGDTFIFGSLGIGTDPFGGNAKFKIFNTDASMNTVRIDDSSGDTTPFLIDNSGNVGIGTSTPTAKLDVNGTVKIRNIQMPTGQTYDSDNDGTLGHGDGDRILVIDKDGTVKAKKLEDLYFEASNVRLGSLIVAMIAGDVFSLFGDLYFNNW